MEVTPDMEDTCATNAILRWLQEIGVEEVTETTETVTTGASNAVKR